MLKNTSGHDLKPYRYRRQRYSTLVIRAPERFLKETFLPEYDRMVEVLGTHLSDLLTPNK